ncbi:alkaline phosphatase family protein [Caldilinea sp.]|uniref:alkaline phosphatase family protein n=1 Tax=Caldilinea sp. TaxID=2293560 RepID=UPI002B60BFBD|nr:alkaline phosphatase family protein [Caldilinea sp.]HRA65267.1 alkaline phosphatase family protein [Caldilinea sp.]
MVTNVFIASLLRVIQRVGPIALMITATTLGQIVSVQAQTSRNFARPAQTPIEHLIVLMQENHSFDNYFGAYPGADGIPPGVCMPIDPFSSANTECVKPFRIGDNDVELSDPDHSDSTHQVQYNDGRMDGFVFALNQRNQDGRLAMGYYDGTQLPYYWNIADEYVLFDRFFSSAASGSFTNHMYWVAAAPEPEAGVAPINSLPTIFDRLQEAGVTWKFYVQNYDAGLNYRTSHLYPGNRASQVIWVPLLNMDRFLDDPELASHIVDLNEYHEDMINGALPQVAYLVPSGPSEHPPSSIMSGQRFVKTLIQMLMQSDYWDRSAFLWTYDDWGGWYDHVRPPRVDAHGYGFRVPALLVSAYARRGYIDSTTLDYTSIIKFISDNWNLHSLAERDAQADTFINAFDFAHGPREPAFVQFERDAAVTKPAPRRPVIYLIYGAGIILSSAFIFVTLIWQRNGRRRIRYEEDIWKRSVE